MEPKNPANGTRSHDVHLSPVGIADRMVLAEMIERNIKRAQAECLVARRAGVSPSSITNLRRGRIKNGEALGFALKRAFAAFLERQVNSLEHELAIARAECRECDLAAAEVAVLAARRALKGEVTT